MQHTKIGWADHTFNPVRGCSKVSDGCKHCYAETMSKRNQAVLGIWGPQGTRVEASHRAWLEVHRWNRSAKKAGRRQTVFCASMSDIGEDRPEWVGPRQRLTEIVLETPWLTWLLLTKRPENLARLFAELINAEPDNVWWGASVENQEMANERIPHLIQMPGHHFLSCEPLLGFVDIEKWAHAIQWVIAGGESGPRARPMHPHWATYLRDQCKHTGIPFFFKQWGHWVPNDSDCWEQTHYPEWDRCRTVWPSGKTARGGSGTYMNDGIDMFPAGKKEAGNMLYTEFHEEFPYKAERESVDLDWWPKSENTGPESRQGERYMTSQENCLKCRHHWSQFQEQARTPGHYCYLFVGYIPDCQQWRGGELGRPSSELGGHPANRGVHPSDWIILDMMVRRYLRDGERLQKLFSEDLR